MKVEDYEIVNHLQQTHLIHSNGHLKQLLLKIIEAMRILRPISCSMMAETPLFILAHLMAKSIRFAGQGILSFQRREIQIVLLFIFLDRQYQKTYYHFQLFRTQTVTPWCTRNNTRWSVPLSLGQSFLNSLCITQLFFS